MDEIISKVTAVLVETGKYQELQSPLKVGDLDFRFESILAGPGERGGLVIVTAFTENVGPSLARRIRGLVTLLDRMGSRRTVSLVVISRGEPSFNVPDIERYCHVVVVRPDLSLERSLRTSLPLVLPTAATQSSYDDTSHE